MEGDVGTRELAAAQRADLLVLLEGLTPAQWELPSLCRRWRVREVVAHIISYDALSWGQLGRRFAAGRFSVDRINAIGVEAARDLSTEDLLGQLRIHLEPSGLTAAMGAGVALTDGLIHSQDIARAVGMRKTVPAERLERALPFALRAPTLPARRLARGLALQATDVDWRHGEGPLVGGPGEALLMAVAGRPAALADLYGDGVSILSERLAT